MRSGFLFSVLVIFLVASVNAHTWLQCTKQEGNNCRGFIRNYRGRNIQGSVDDFYTNKALGRPNNHPLCKSDTQSSIQYSNQFPMARALPGETLRVTYTPNGHSAPGDPGRRTTSRIHWTGRPNSQLRTRGELNAGNRLAEWNFANNCATSGDVASLPCTNGFTLPNNIAPGVYSFVWYWPYDRNPDQRPLGEEYFSCFEVEVLPPPTPNQPNEPTSEVESTQSSSEADSTASSEDPSTEASSEMETADDVSNAAKISFGFLGIFAILFL